MSQSIRRWDLLAGIITFLWQSFQQSFFTLSQQFVTKTKTIQTYIHICTYIIHICTFICMCLHFVFTWGASISLTDLTVLSRLKAMFFIFHQLYSWDNLICLLLILYVRLISRACRAHDVRKIYVTSVCVLRHVFCLCLETQDICLKTQTENFSSVSLRHVRCFGAFLIEHCSPHNSSLYLANRTSSKATRLFFTKYKVINATSINLKSH